MKLYLFGGAGGEAASELKLISDTIHSVHPKQVLWVPFARIQPSSDAEWLGDWPHRYMDWSGIEFLDASSNADISKVEDPLVFISGGSKGRNLMDELDRRPELVRIIRDAQYVVGESKGSMALGKCFRARSSDTTSRETIEGLNIVPDTIIEAHYTQFGLQETLVQEVRELGLSHGIGIDTVTGIAFETSDFPAKWEKIGEGNVEVKDNTDII